MYKAVLAALGARPGDILIARLHPPYLTIRLARPERIIPIDTFGPEVLPPSWPGHTDNITTPNECETAVSSARTVRKTDNATTPDDTESTIAPTT
jgi:hypothetical protein